LRWIQDGPVGPAWHALLETPDAEIVGHTSLIPLRTAYRGTPITPAKSEYSFIREEFRSVKIQGFERSARPKFLILVDQLFRHCATLGWGPFLISTTPALHKLGPRVQCYPVDFPLRECLLILKPWASARSTPNLTNWQRAALFFVGGLQSILWRVIPTRSGGGSRVRSIPIASCAVEEFPELLSFFEDEDSLRWRYLEGQYERLAIESLPLDYTIVKRGGEERYLRVCQWSFTSSDSVAPFVKTMVRMARTQSALGVRWAVYGHEAAAQKVVARLRRLGFVCVSRVRTELIHSENQELRTPAAWKMNDAMFTFDP
ncbi:MAG: hypothetical protein ACLP3K_06535, partial [Candidatus Acidiferrales bacterium]